MLSFDSMELQFCVIELCSWFMKLPDWYQSAFLQHLQDQFAAIDDEFSEIIDTIFLTFEGWLTHREQGQVYSEKELCEELELRLGQTVEHFEGPQLQNVQLVLESMIKYAQEEFLE